MNLTIKNLSPRLHKKLKGRAATHNRSINGEVMDILQSVLEPRPLTVEDWLTETAKVQARLNVAPVTEELLRHAKNEGRS